MTKMPMMIIFYAGVEMLRASQTQHGSSKLALWLRLYIYGLHGFFIEILFTAGWEFTVSGNWKLPGNFMITLSHLYKYLFIHQFQERRGQVRIFITIFHLN
jgi:hypothetical protein